MNEKEQHSITVPDIDIFNNMLIIEKLREYNFKDEFIQCVSRCFYWKNNYSLASAGISDTIALYICAKYFGYVPSIHYDVCNWNNWDYVHAWIEISDVVIDCNIFEELIPVTNIVPFVGKREFAPIEYECESDNFFIDHLHLSSHPLSDLMDSGPKAKEELVSTSIFWIPVYVFLDHLELTDDFVNYLHALVQDDYPDEIIANDLIKVFSNSQVHSEEVPEILN